MGPPWGPHGPPRAPQGPPDPPRPGGGRGTEIRISGPRPAGGISDPGRVGAGFEAKSKPILVEKRHVGNVERIIFPLAEFRDLPYVKSWVCLVFGILRDFSVFFLRIFRGQRPGLGCGDSLCGNHTEEVCGRSVVRGKVWSHGILPTHTRAHTPKIAVPRCGGTALLRTHPPAGLAGQV